METAYVQVYGLVSSYDQADAGVQVGTHKCQYYYIPSLGLVIGALCSPVAGHILLFPPILSPNHTCFPPAMLPLSTDPQK